VASLRFYDFKRTTQAQGFVAVAQAGTLLAD